MKFMMKEIVELQIDESHIIIHTPKIIGAWIINDYFMLLIKLMNASLISSECTLI